MEKVSNLSSEVGSEKCAKKKETVNEQSVTYFRSMYKSVIIILGI